MLPTGERLGQGNTQTEHDGTTEKPEEASTNEEKSSKQGRMVQLVPRGQLPCAAQVLYAPNGTFIGSYLKMV